jgi:tetratricopeptide (TPR) repeat protein
VSADVETVCLKAMDRERARRYVTAGDLARDLANGLARRPIEARRPGPMVHALRWVQRNRALAASLLLGLVLATGVPIALYFQQHHYSAKLEQALEDARRDAETSNLSLGFLSELFKGADPSVSGGEPSVRDLLDRGVAKLQGAFPNRPEVRSVLLDSIGEVYAQLGAYDKARALLEESLALMAKTPERGWSEHDFRNRPHSTRVWRATVQSTLADVFLRAAQPARAEELLRSALPVYEEVDGPDSARVANVLTSLGNALAAQGRAKEAEPLERRSLAILRGRSDTDPNDLAIVTMNLGMLLYGYLARADEAREYLESAVASLRASGKDLPTLAGALSNLALLELRQGRVAEADALYQEAIALARKVLAGNERLAGFLFNRARLLHPDPEAALACHEEASKILASYPWELPIRLMNEAYHGITLERLGLLEDADRVLSELMPHLRGHVPVEEPRLLQEALLVHARCLEKLGHPEIASDLRQEARLEAGARKD